MDPYTLAYVAGHSDFATTRRYVHPNLEHGREASLNLRGNGQFLGKAVSLRCGNMAVGPTQTHLVARSSGDVLTLSGWHCMLVNCGQEINKSGEQSTTTAYSLDSAGRLPRWTPLDATPFTRVIALASSGASSPLSAASTASFRTAVIRTLIEAAAVRHGSPAP
jgi:hypothetical protein